MSRYLLGVSAFERRRLEFQESVWGWMTRAMLDRLGVGPGWACLDVGAGIGCVSLPLARRVGTGGRVVALEPSPAYAAFLRRRAARSRNLAVVESPLERFDGTGGPFDLMLCRWVFLFLRDLERALARLVPHLKRGGLLVVEDYHNYDGLTLHPESAAFARLIRGARRWFRRNGGDLRVAGRLLPVFRRLGLDVVEFRPNVMAGDGRSGVFRWAGRFFCGHVDAMVRDGCLTRREAEAFLAEWRRRARDPATRFVSPLIFDVVGRRPSR